MSELPVQQAEREELCDLMLDLGPDAPTLCEGWTTYDMAAHLYVREHNPVASVGIVLAAAAALHDKAITKAKADHPYEELVAKVRKGPPMHWKPVDAPFNTQEYFVHHEDVRRGDGDSRPRPESEVAAVEAALWKGLQRGHRLATRKVHGVEINFVTPDGKTIHSGKGDESVTITGRPGEIILYLSGRKSAAQVELTGSPEAIATVEAADLGI